MPRQLILSLDGREFPVSLMKIDRDKLYGSVEIEAFDEKGREASLRVLAADGTTPVVLDLPIAILHHADNAGISCAR